MSRSSSMSDVDFCIARFDTTRTGPPSISGVEELIKLELAIQQEIGVQLGVIGSALEKDLRVTRRLSQHHVPSGNQNPILDQLQEVWNAHQAVDERAAVVRAKSEAIRDRHIVVKRQLSTSMERAEREMQRVDERQASLAKADKALNEAARWIMKAEIEGKTSPRGKGTLRRLGKRVDSGGMACENSSP